MCPCAIAVIFMALPEQQKGIALSKRIKMIVPVPVPQAALGAFAAQIPAHVMKPGYAVEFACATRGGSTLDSHYEGAIADAFCLDAGASAEAEGFAAVCINSMSDSGVAALRSRLTIPVVGTAQATYHLAAQLGGKFSILSMWDSWLWLYRKGLRENGVESRLASIRSIGVRPDTAELLAGKEDGVFPLLLDAANKCIEQDGAELIILGSTTMHQSHNYLAGKLPVPVLNPGLIGYKTCEMMLDLEMSHSKRSYPSPERIIDDVFVA